MATEPPREPLAERLRRAPVTLLIGAVCIGVMIVAERHGSTTTTPTLLEFGATERAHVWGGETWRLVTATFLHVGIIHLVWNLYAGFGWCAAVEGALGSRRFLFAYLLAGVGGSVASVLCHDAVSAGASGAMFGIVGVMLALVRRRLGSWQGFIDEPSVRRILVTMAIWTGLGLTVVRMDTFAHAGGLVTGAATGWVLTETGAGRTRGWAILFAGLLLAGVAAVRPLNAQLSLQDAQQLTQYAVAYQRGELVARNPARAARFARRACAVGWADGCALLMQESPR